MPSRSKEQWQLLIDKFNRSDLTNTEFCQQHNLKPNYFTSVRSKFRLKDNVNNSTDDCSFITATVKPDSLEVIQQGSIIIEYRNSSIKLPIQMPATDIANLIRALHD